MSLASIFDRLETQENALLGTRVLAPILDGRRVTVKVGGVACQLAISNGAKGWGVLEVESTQRARWLRAATLSEREKYLALLPAVRFIALARAGEVWMAHPAHAGDRRFRLNGAAPIRDAATSNLQAFDTVLARFDGTHFWFERIDARRPPAIAQYLRESLAASVSPDDLRKKGLSLEERAAYAYALYGSPEKQDATVGDFRTSLNPHAANARTPDGRLAQSLGHAGDVWFRGSIAAMPIQ